MGGKGRGQPPDDRSKNGSQNPHPNVAKGATLGWGTRIFQGQETGQAPSPHERGTATLEMLQARVSKLYATAAAASCGG